MTTEFTQLEIDVMEKAVVDKRPSVPKDISNLPHINSFNAAPLGSNVLLTLRDGAGVKYDFMLSAIVVRSFVNLIACELRGRRWSDATGEPMLPFYKPADASEFDLATKVRWDNEFKSNIPPLPMDGTGLAKVRSVVSLACGGQDNSLVLVLRTKTIRYHRYILNSMVVFHLYRKLLQLASDREWFDEEGEKVLATQDVWVPLRNNLTCNWSGAA